MDTVRLPQNSDVPPLIDEAVRRLVDAAHPEAIILFGSFARGDANEDSDLDFLVIVPSVRDRHGEIVRLHRALSSLRMPIDILLYSRDEIRERGHIPSTTLHDALIEGRVLYGSA